MGAVQKAILSLLLFLQQRASLLAELLIELPQSLLKCLALLGNARDTVFGRLDEGTANEKVLFCRVSNLTVRSSSLVGTGTSGVVSAAGGASSSVFGAMVGWWVCWWLENGWGSPLRRQSEEEESCQCVEKERVPAV